MDGGNRKNDHRNRPMKKVALVFVLAVFVPSLVLAWLAVRSLRDQQIVLERQQTLLYQSVADTRAADIARHLEDLQKDFRNHVERLLTGAAPRDLAQKLDVELRDGWPLAEIGFAVSLDGEVLAPSLFGGPEARKFRLENDRFLCSRETVEVYWQSPKGAINLSKLDQKAETEKTAKDGRTVFPAKEASGDPASKVMAEETAFRQLIGEGMDGTFARFLQDQLHVFLWHRSARDPQLLFGAQLNLTRVVGDLKDLVQTDPALQSEICVALLDDAGRPVALSHLEFVPGIHSGLARERLRRIGLKPLTSRNAPSVSTVIAPVKVSPELQESFRDNWKHPFVAAEVGEVLPHWEVAVYLLNPASLGQAARTLRLMLGLLITVLVLAIGAGSWLIVADLKRQLTLARQKTDFVSNVSHELKTPLTSIRMFSELLAEGRVQEASKQRHYLNIITAEAARLTRLINNVLDFARLERGEKKYQMEQCDLAALVRETVEAYRPHLEANGFRLESRLPDTPVWVAGDRDALSQVLVNLLSNAEKYSGEKKEVAVRVEQPDNSTAEIRVLDRGFGVPKGCEEKVFEQFYRVHDSLASVIQGSGLGLTLARQIARAHGGDVVYKPREGGGSCFSLKLPVREGRDA